MKFKTWRKLWIALAEIEKELGLNITQEQIDAAAKRARDMVAEAAEKGLAAPVGDRAYALGGVFAEN